MQVYKYTGASMCLCLCLRVCVLVPETGHMRLSCTCKYVLGASTLACICVHWCQNVHLYICMCVYLLYGLRVSERMCVC